MSDSYVSSYKAPEIIDFDEPYTSRGDVDFTFHSAKLREDHTEIELDYTLNKVPELNIPYEYNLLNLTLDLQTGNEKYQYDFSSNNSLRIKNIDISASHKSKVVFPDNLWNQ